MLTETIATLALGAATTGAVVVGAGAPADETDRPWGPPFGGNVCERVDQLRDGGGPFGGRFAGRAEDLPEALVADLTEIRDKALAGEYGADIQARVESRDQWRADLEERCS